MPRSVFCLPQISWRSSAVPGAAEDTAEPPLSDGVLEHSEPTRNRGDVMVGRVANTMMRVSYVCPTPCEPDCDYRCHEKHVPAGRRRHDAMVCEELVLGFDVAPLEYRVRPDHRHSAGGPPKDGHPHFRQCPCGEAMTWTGSRWTPTAWLARRRPWMLLGRRWYTRG
jgi:hypothetical protein